MSDSDQQAAAPQATAPQATAPQAAAPQAAAPQAIPAVGFLVMAFTDATAADQALDAMKDAKKQQQFYFEDAAVITQDAQGKVHYHETGDMSAGKGAGIGAIVGGVMGILGGPAGVVVGAGAGAAIGGALASHDGGFKNESLETIGVALKPGNSAVAVITSHDFLKAMQQQVPIEDIRTVVSNLAAETLGAARGEQEHGHRSDPDRNRACHQGDRSRRNVHPGCRRRDHRRRGGHRRGGSYGRRRCLQGRCGDR